MIFCDLETYSPTPIKHGTYRYAERAEVMLFAYALGEGEVQCWDVTTGAPMPADLAAALADPHCTTVWHNGAMFDAVVLRAAGIADLPPERIHDTMVRAMAHSLPGSLGQLCEIFRMPTDQAKDKDGKALIQLFCKPRPKNATTPRATRETHPAEWGRFIEYAKSDIRAMRVLFDKLPHRNDTADERGLWMLDQRINRRGVAIDTELAAAALAAVGREQQALAVRTQALTDGEVESATKRDQMLEHILGAYGVALPDMQASTLERRIADPDLPEPLCELLRVRLAACTTSTSKYTAVLNSVSADGRLRNLLQFCGAGRTGRWSGRLFQPQNLPRPSLDQEDIDAGIEYLKAGCADLLAPDVMQLASSALRGLIVAPPGKKKVVADLSNIEGRVQAWLAGEAWKLEAFRLFDAGLGPDLYKLAYSKSFGADVAQVTKDQRQVGKVQELALGYEGGVSAFVTFAAAYSMDLEALAQLILGAADPAIVAEARGFLEWCIKEGRPTYGLSDDAFVACDALKRAWRYAHPRIATMWKALDGAVRAAIATPDKRFKVGARLSVQRTGAWLHINLPSGRALCYPSPRIDDKNRITYMGNNQYTRKWERLTTYGGKLFENVCQGVARDVMAANMPRIEAAGYEITLTVHDEILSETPDTDAFSADGLSALLAHPPRWALDLPLAAAGFETYRYRKD